MRQCCHHSSHRNNAVHRNKQCRIRPTHSHEARQRAPACVAARRVATSTAMADAGGGTRSGDTPGVAGAGRKKKQKRSRLVDRNSPVVRVKGDGDGEADEAFGGGGGGGGMGGENADAEAAAAAAGGDAAEASRLADMLARERERQQAKKERAARRKRDAEIKKKQISRATLKKAMLYRHWTKLEDKINHPPPPKAKETKEAVNQPGGVEVGAEFTHPATASYHTMKKLPTDPRRVNPIFLDYPVDLQSARTPLVPDWKRALERKRPLPMHPSERSPAMLGYAMHARAGWDVAIFNPIFYSYKTATGSHLDEEGRQELIRERESLYPHRPRFMWELRDQFMPCFLCGRPEGEVKACVRCGRRKGELAEVSEQFNFVEAREVAAQGAVAEARGKDKEAAALAKTMARVNYVDVLIKPMPMGKVVNLRLDNRSTMQYLYFMYRTNVGGELAVHHSVNLFLPTYQGVFYLDWKVIPETPTSLGSDAGYFTLADYNVLKAGATVSLIESPTYRKRQCESLFNLYLTRNLVHDASRQYNKELQYYHDRLPALVPHPDDFIQTAMQQGIRSMEAHWLDDQQRRAVLQRMADRVKARDAHRQQVLHSGRFEERARRLLASAQGNLAVKAAKARMKARKREEREQALQRRLEQHKVVRSPMELLDRADAMAAADDGGGGGGDDDDDDDDGWEGPPQQALRRRQDNPFGR